MAGSNITDYLAFFRFFETFGYLLPMYSAWSYDTYINGIRMLLPSLWWIFFCTYTIPQAGCIGNGWNAQMMQTKIVPYTDFRNYTGVSIDLLPKKA